jgi:glutathione S-transferase
MTTVHHLENSRSQRVLWLLEELDVDYDIVSYRRDPQTMLAPPELRAIHPLGKSPVVVDGGDVLAESGAIIEALVERHDRQHVLTPPPGSAERLRWRYWLHYAEGSAMPPLLLGLVFSRIRQAPMPFFARPVARGIVGKAMAAFIGPQLKLHAGYLEAELAKADWFAGPSFSAADIQMSFPVEALSARLGLEHYPRLRDWLQRIHARPAWRRALERGGPYALPG